MVSLFSKSKKTSAAKTKPAEDKTSTQPASEFGGHVKKEFPFDAKWKNLNHGSFGSAPNAIMAKFREYQDLAEARPDAFLRYDCPKLLDESRLAVASLINAPVDDVVLVNNATEAVNTVFRNLEWNEDGKDVIITFNIIYEGCGKTADFIVDYFQGKVSSKEIDLYYPMEDEEIIAKFKNTVAEIEAEGKRARICIFDVVSSRPGLLFPWIDMIKACKELNVISMVDGAQGVGMVPLDLSAADPDFFVSNCHKWLFVPRACAMFYVPARNQALLRTTLSTSHGYKPKTSKRTSPFAANTRSPFVANFQWVGTRDDAAYYCVKDAIAWRLERFGGEKKIIDYLWDLNKNGSKRVADILGTYVMENKAGTLTNCAMANVALPVWVNERGEGAKEGDAVVPEAEADYILQWMKETQVDTYNTFMSLYIADGRFWVRTSSQVYLDLDDFTFAGRALMELSGRVARGQYPKPEK